MKKKLSKLLLTAILSVSVLPNQIFAHPSSREYAEIEIDTREINLSNKAFIEKGITYIPFKDLFNELNMKVTYDPNTKEVVGENKLLNMKFTIGKPAVTINGVTHKADASIVENGVAYVPINYLNKKGTQLSSEKHPTVNIITIKGRMIRKKIHNSTEYYLGEGYTDNFSEFVPDGQGKEYKNGNVRKEPYNTDGKTGYYKDGKYEGWFIEYIPKGHTSGADYRLGEFIDGNIKIAYYYNENGDLLYTKDNHD